MKEDINKLLEEVRFLRVLVQVKDYRIKQAKKKSRKKMNNYQDRLIEVLKVTGQLNKNDIKYCKLLTDQYFKK